MHRQQPQLTICAYFSSYLQDCMNTSLQKIIFISLAILLAAKAIAGSVTPDATICKGQSIQISASPGACPDAQTTYAWSHGLGNSKTQTVSPAATTTYKVTINNNCNGTIDTLSVTITVLSPLKVKANGRTVSCSGDTVSLIANPTGGDSTRYKYLWVFPDGSTDTAQKIIAKPFVESRYMIKLTDGCTTIPDSAYILVTVPPPIIAQAGNDTTICFGWKLPLTVKISGGVATQYKITWNEIGGGYTDTGKTVVITPPVSAKYTVGVTDGCSLSALDTISIAVLPQPIAVIGPISSSGCVPFELKFTDASQNHDTSRNVWWLDTVKIKSSPPSITITKDGYYYPALKVSNQLGCSDSVRGGKLIISPSPTAAFISNPAFKRENEPVTFQNESKDATRYTWYLGDDNPIDRTDNASEERTFADTGFYPIRLVAYNQYNCPDTADTLIYISPPFTYTIPTAFTPNGDYLNDTFAPFVTALDYYKLTVFNRWGEVVHTCESPCSWNGTFNNYPAEGGLYSYLLVIKSRDEIVKTINGIVTLVR